MIIAGCGPVQFLRHDVQIVGTDPGFQVSGFVFPVLSSQTQNTGNPIIRPPCIKLGLRQFFYNTNAGCRTRIQSCFLSVPTRGVATRKEVTLWN